MKCGSIIWLDKRPRFVYDSRLKCKKPDLAGPGFLEWVKVNVDMFGTSHGREPVVKKNRNTKSRSTTMLLPTYSGFVKAKNTSPVVEAPDPLTSEFRVNGKTISGPFPGWPGILSLLDGEDFIVMRDGSTLAMFPVRPGDEFRGVS